MMNDLNRGEREGYLVQELARQHDERELELGESRAGGGAQA